jgi:hypothetical protein
VTTDSSWFWGFLAAEQGGASRSYQRFWGNAVRWLVRDPAVSPVQVTPDRPAVEPGETVGLSVSVRAPDYGPGAGAPVAVDLVSEDGKVIGHAEGTAGPDGVAHLEVVPSRPGAYKVVATARPGCKAQQPCPAETAAVQSTGAVSVRSAGPEDWDAAPRPELLRAIADATDGAYGDVDGGFPAVRLRDPDVIEVGRRKDVPVWDRGWYLALLVLTLGAEWTLRRRWGYW